jgi:uncharacterized protein (TIGR01777 family)
MKVVLAGGSGHLGQLLARAFAADGDDVVVLARSEKRDGARSGGARVVAWDGRSLGEWTHEIDGSNVVVNLAGRSVNCRYTDANLREMLASRVDSARVVGEAIRGASSPPRVWLQMSTATIYAHRFDAPNDELTGILGGAEPDAPAYWSYSIRIAREWEKEQVDAKTPRTRKVALRSAMVLGIARGTVFDILLGLVRRGLGGPVGGGRQFVSWIHESDFVRAVRMLVLREDLIGPVNLASPNPLPYRDFMRALREAWGIGIGLPATKWMLEIAAFVLRTDSELVMKSRRVVPRRLLEAGFEFEYPDWPTAARELVARWRDARP